MGESYGRKLWMRKLWEKDIDEKMTMIYANEM